MKTMVKMVNTQTNRIPALRLETSSDVSVRFHHSMAMAKWGRKNPFSLYPEFSSLVSNSAARILKAGNFQTQDQFSYPAVLK